MVPLQRCWWYCGRWIIAGWDANPTPRWPPLRLTSPQSPRSRLRPPFAHHLFSSPSSFTQFASRTSATRPRNHACLSKDRKTHISVILICLSFYNFYLLWNFFYKTKKNPTNMSGTCDHMSKTCRPLAVPFILPFAMLLKAFNLTVNKLCGQVKTSNLNFQTFFVSQPDIKMFSDRNSYWVLAMATSILPLLIVHTWWIIVKVLDGVSEYN